MRTAAILRELFLVSKHALLPGFIVADIADHLHRDLQIFRDGRSVLAEETSVLLGDGRHDVRGERSRAREKRFIPCYASESTIERTDC